MKPHFLIMGIGIGCLCGNSAGAMSVILNSSTPSPAPLGTTIIWQASVTEAAGGVIWYRFRQRALGGDYRLIRDYGPLSSLNWNGSDREGLYEIEVSARNRNTGDTETTSAVFQMQSRVSPGQTAINSTSHPLVFLYSATCNQGSRMVVEFWGPDNIAHLTSFKTCVGNQSLNFYLAGLNPTTLYTARHYVLDSDQQFTAGPLFTFTTGRAPFGLFTEGIIQAPAGLVSDPILLGTSLNGATATDLKGRLLWFTNNGISYITRAELDGCFWGLVEAFGASDPSQESIRKFDLVGMTLLETNAARVNEQLVAMGKRPISAFHHEVRTLPDGKIVALADVEQILTGVQGPGPVDILGDMMIVFDSQLNVLWTWDTFDHLDVTRSAVLHETCVANGGCSPFFLAKDGNDWTHGNSIGFTPDGNLLYSSRNQDWLIKVDYQNGLGDGHVIWRLGQGGDFQIQSSDPYPWFSHQHDGNFDRSDPTLLLVFDDGNTRFLAQGGNSRGQALRIDEQSLTASLVLNADLGVYSTALGSAQKLLDGEYHFDAGAVGNQFGVTGYSMEVGPDGKIAYETRASTVLYRSFRMSDMYTPY